ncbi:ABC transporter permease (plasmid) [Rhizobium leguminosarum]|uniref:ABC transporter permease n=2 Tax=Rhizobium TaxID=379 RepID=A0ABZ1DTX9_9HYPH|nr:MULTISPECIES: ABC transporter permease [Rhizobium]AXA42915.1 Binding-protein-dependent transport system inner membrane component family protein [Rhizobium leguminosarum]NNU52097.1 ABC transporter permease [Rhizobium indigoferae]TBY18115.1 ABC transporter permease [Rhizobium leguminosarum bv. viciae]TBY25985.1 ABC transporter permease [Rhizobium leguminosarum bv. viciae]TBZ04601.1 ABC transporter permease [Rhizobium leguminosarum bv. viciae]
MTTTVDNPRVVPARPASWFFSRSARQYSHALTFLLIAPLMLLLAGGFIYPIGRLVSLSLMAPGFTLEHYERIVTEPLYMEVLLRTLQTGAIVTVTSLLLGFPVSFLMAHAKGRMAMLVSAAVLVPLWTSVLVRSYAWIVLLQRNGIVNGLLIESGLIGSPLKLIYTEGAVILAMTHVLMPFMILPVYNVLRTIPAEYTQAARNLGAGPISAFWRVTLPLSLPGIFAGCVMCFILAIGFYITPALVGGPGALMMATLIGQQTTVLLDWPFAAALATVLLTTTLIFVLVFRKALSVSKGMNSVN